MNPLDIPVPSFETARHASPFAWMNDPNSHCPACGENPKGVDHKCKQTGYRSFEALEAAEEDAFNSCVNNA